MPVLELVTDEPEVVGRLEVVAWGGAGSTLAATIERLGSDAELVTVIGGREAPFPMSEIDAHAPGGIELEVQEAGMRFAVDVTAPLGAGLFPDLREGRRAVAERARGRRVLNLFSYTGAFSVWAGKGGAAQVTSLTRSVRTAS